jgi:hypothetical protein
MRIQFKSEGGFAYFPGLAKPVTIDSDELPEEEIGELQQLLSTTRFFELPQNVGKLTPQAADCKRYKVTVENQDRSHTVQMTDMIDDPDLQKLLAFLKGKAKQARSSGKGEK